MTLNCLITVIGTFAPGRELAFEPKGVAVCRISFSQLRTLNKHEARPILSDEKCSEKDSSFWPYDSWSRTCASVFSANPYLLATSLKQCSFRLLCVFPSRHSKNILFTAVKLLSIFFTVRAVQRCTAISSTGYSWALITSFVSGVVWKRTERFVQDTDCSARSYPGAPRLSWTTLRPSPATRMMNVS